MKPLKARPQARRNAGAETQKQSRPRAIVVIGMRAIFQKETQRLDRIGHLHHNIMRKRLGIAPTEMKNRFVIIIDQTGHLPFLIVLRITGPNLRRVYGHLFFRFGNYFPYFRQGLCLGRHGTHFSFKPFLRYKH